MQYDAYEVVLDIDVVPISHKVKLIDDVSIIDLGDDWQVVKRDQGNTRVGSLIIEGEFRHVVGLVAVVFDVQETNSHTCTFCHCSSNNAVALGIIEIAARCLCIPK